MRPLWFNLSASRVPAHPGDTKEKPRLRVPMAHIQGSTSFPHLSLWLKQTEFHICFHTWPADFSILRCHWVYIFLEKQDFIKILLISPTSIGPRPNILIAIIPPNSRLRHHQVFSPWTSRNAPNFILTCNCDFTFKTSVLLGKEAEFEDVLYSLENSALNLKICLFWLDWHLRVLQRKILKETNLSMLLLVAVFPPFSTVWTQGHLFNKCYRTVHILKNQQHENKTE